MFHAVYPVPGLRLLGVVLVLYIQTMRGLSADFYTRNRRSTRYDGISAEDGTSRWPSHTLQGMERPG